MSSAIRYGSQLLATTITTDWQSYTPTFNGLGTPSAINMQYRRVGDSIEILGKFTAGTTTASEMRVSLPSGLVSDSGKITSLTKVGSFTKAAAVSAGNGGQWEVYVESNISYLTFGLYNPNFNGLTKQNGSTLVSTGETVSLHAMVPISGWSSGGGNNTAIYSLSDWTAYTPTISGLGSTSNLSAFYRRVGDTLQVTGWVTIGSPAASLVTITLPSGLLIDNTKIPVSNTTSTQGQAVGYIWGNDGSSGGVSEPIVLLTATGTSTALIYAGKSGATANQLIPANGNAIYTNSNDPISFQFSVPISGWTATASGTLTAPRSEITVDSGNGFGSTNTTVRRFTNTRKSVGSAIIYADSASNGASFTINESGVYAIEYHDQSSTGAATIGITVNSTALTTSPANITYAQGVRTFMDSSAANFGAHVHWTGNLSAGDVVRAQAGTAANSTNERCMFTIVKVSN